VIAAASVIQWGDRRPRLSLSFGPRGQARAPVPHRIWDGLPRWCPECLRRRDDSHRTQRQAIALNAGLEFVHGPQGRQHGCAHSRGSIRVQWGFETASLAAALLHEPHRDRGHQHGRRSGVWTIPLPL